MIILRLIQKELTEAHIEQKGGIHSSWHKFNHLRKPEIQEETSNKHMSKYLKTSSNSFSVEQLIVKSADSASKNVKTVRILNG